MDHMSLARRAREENEAIITEYVYTVCTEVATGDDRVTDRRLVCRSEDREGKRPTLGSRRRGRCHRRRSCNSSSSSDKRQRQRTTNPRLLN